MHKPDKADKDLPCTILQDGINFSFTHPTQHYDPDHLLFTRTRIAGFPVVNGLRRYSEQCRHYLSGQTQSLPKRFKSFSSKPCLSLLLVPF